MEKALVDKVFIMEKFPGKGGWTYVILDDIKLEKNKPFGWAMVKGTVDSCEIKKYNLMPMGNGRMFLPIKSEIRKKIKKEAGDEVYIRLFKDIDPLEIPEEFLLCLEDDLQARHFFWELREGEQKVYLDWIYSAKREETRVNRIAMAINKLSRRLKYFDKE